MTRFGWIVCEPRSRCVVRSRSRRGTKNEERRAEALSGVANVFAQDGQQERALATLRQALATARLAGRQSVFEVLESGAAMLARIDRGKSLWRIWEAVLEVDSWWAADSGA